MVLQIKPLLSPATCRGRRSFISYAPPLSSEREVASSESPKQIVFEKSPPRPSSIKNGSVSPHFEDLQNKSVSEGDFVHSPPPVEVSEELTSVDEFYQVRNFISASASRERDRPSDAEESDQTVQNDKENVTKTGVCNTHGDKKSRTSTNGLRMAKPIASNNVVIKPKRATAGNASNL